MVEEQIEEELLAANIEQSLSLHEGEPRAQFQQELGHVLHQRGLDLAFTGLSAEAQKVESIGVLQRLSHKIGLRLREPLFEVRDGLARALDCTEVDVMVEHVARPAVRQRGVCYARRALRAFSRVSRTRL